MIITQTPLRISFAGGGTDLKEFYRREGGAVVSTAIDKYIYVVIKERFDAKIRVGYTKTEMVDSIDEIQHELVREALRKTGIGKGVEIATMADIPSEGSGLGSSSTVTVGLLNAMYAYLGEIRTAAQLAQEACEIEIDILKKPIGKQDQYIAAFGGVRLIEFRPDDSVNVEAVPLEQTKRNRLSESLLLFYTGVTRKADVILSEQRDKIQDTAPILTQMRQQAYDVYECLSAGDITRLGMILHEAWEHKKKLAGKISNPEIDKLYESARSAGALGGKVTGAGGGGFFLVACPPGKQEGLRGALRGMREMPFGLERDGTKVIFNVRR
jgi:D-glycero-alpha-D-manno-heptose-7-phosphate kinase